MRVAVLSGTSRINGGIFYAVKWLTLALNKQGCDLEICGPHDKYTLEDMPVWAPLAVQHYNSFGPLHFSFALSGLLQKMNADLVHCHGIWQDAQRVALQWQKRTRKPVMISPHGMLDPWAVKNSAWKKKVVGALFANDSLNKATCIHALCQSEAESIRAYGLKNPIAIIPNGVELPDIDAGKEKFQLDSVRRKRLLFLGRIHPKKGLSELIRAWHDIANCRTPFSKEWQLLIAGWDDGGHLKCLQQQATDLNIPWVDFSKQSCKNLNLDSLTGASLLFCGPRFGEEKDALLRTVDAFILPSFSEGLPMSVLETWAYGIPGLITPFCNINEGVLPNSATEIMPEALSIEKGLMNFFSLSDQQRHQMGQNGLNLVKDKFTWEKIAAEMSSVYQWALGGGEPPLCVVTG